MAIAHSRLTTQGQISVPAEVRRKLGLGPGSVIEWDEDAGRIVVRRAGSSSWDDVHKAVFPSGPLSPPKTLEDMKEGIRSQTRKKHGSGR